MPRISLTATAWIGAYGPYRSLHAGQRGWDSGVAPPAGARISAIVSVVTWSLVICAGRLIAYV
ncbi:hypothetical protein [Cupriavidus sp. BIC8F]|uniref:hypothetical protein n=1 Tax=Cupriavidus sp. BIC8F TaxID=3079014 RepID=UPI00291610AD|nr:hypothetical protein [Cupriavidus sp. BIC8F]